MSELNVIGGHPTGVCCLLLHPCLLDGWRPSLPNHMPEECCESMLGVCFFYLLSDSVLLYGISQFLKIQKGRLRHPVEIKALCQMPANSGDACNLLLIFKFLLPWELSLCSVEKLKLSLSIKPLLQFTHIEHL
jgi:hypothetical protein